MERVSFIGRAKLCQMDACNGELPDMLRWIGDSLEFLYWLGVLQLARLAVVLFCIAEVVGVLTLWAIALRRTASCTTARSTSAIPVGATLHRGHSSRPLAIHLAADLRSVENIGGPSPNGSQRSSATLSCVTPHPWE